MRTFHKNSKPLEESVVAHLLAIAIICFLFLSPFSADAMPRPANDLPQDLLTACDENANALGQFDSLIAVAVDDLIAAEIFSREDFEGVKIGFCELRKANGPAATTSCGKEIILLDQNYKNSSLALVRYATLAHEMKHVLQHRAKKATYGDTYCQSELYDNDRSALEIEADAFGDAAAERLVLQGKYFRH